jgi:hypothetical protein
MKLKGPRKPKIKRARGNSSVPVGKTINAKMSLQDGIEKRDKELKSLEDELDLSWLVEGALAYVKLPLIEGTSKSNIPYLEHCRYGNPQYSEGTPAIFSEAVRRNVTLRQGPARIVQHTWIMPGGGKFIISLKHLSKDVSCDDEIKDNLT